MPKFNPESGLYLCPTCGVEKPKEDYYKSKDRIDGLDSYCKDCTRQQARDWNKTNSLTRPDGGWNTNNVQELLDSRGHNVLVHGVLSGSKVRKIQPNHKPNNSAAYVTCIDTGEEGWVDLGRTISVFSKANKSKSKAEEVVKILREMDKRLGLVTHKMFYRYKNKDGYVVHLGFSEAAPEGYRKEPNPCFLIKDHDTGREDYFRYDCIKSGHVPFGLGGYDSSKPGVFYLILINDKLIKFGITNNTVDMRYSREYLYYNSYVTVLEVRFEDGKVAQRLESKVKQMVKDVIYEGPDMQFKVTKNTEVFWAYKKGMLSKVMDFVTDTVEKKNGEVLTWENTATTKESKKTSTQLLIPQQLVLDL